MKLRKTLDLCVQDYKNKPLHQNIRMKKEQTH